MKYFATSLIKSKGLGPSEDTRGLGWESMLLTYLITVFVSSKLQKLLRSSHLSTVYWKQLHASEEAGPVVCTRNISFAARF